MGRPTAFGRGRAAACALMLGIAACGGSSAVDVVKATSGAAEKATFVHVTLQTLVDGENVLVSDFSGATDGSLGKGSITVGGQDIEFIVTGGDDYFGFADLPAGISWVKMAKADTAASGFDANTASTASAHEVIAFLRAKGAALTKIGAEAVDGTAATHYRVTLPTANLVVGTGLSASMRAQIVGLFGASMTFDLWVDAQFRPRRPTYEVDLATAPNRPQGLPATGKLQSDIAFRDWDVPVVANPPDPGTAMSLADYRALNQQG